MDAELRELKSRARQALDALRQFISWQWRQWLYGSDPADGRQQCRRSRGRYRSGCRFDRPRQPIEPNSETPADGADADFPPESAPEKTGANGWRAKL